MATAAALSERWHHRALLAAVAWCVAGSSLFASSLASEQDDEFDKLAAAAKTSLEKLARWQYEWNRVAEAEAQRVVESGHANSEAEQVDDFARAEAFLDCDGLGDSDDGFWAMFRDAFSRTGPLSAETGRLAYYKWSRWEDFIDGMAAADAFDGRVYIPLVGEFHRDGTSYHTRIRERKDWVTALQQAQWQVLFGTPPNWSRDNLLGFMACPIGFALVQYIVFVVHKVRSGLTQEEMDINLGSMTYAFVSLLDSHFDHLESSSWNLSSYDMAVNLNHDKRYYTSYREYIEERPAPRAHLPPWRDVWVDNNLWTHWPICKAFINSGGDAPRGEDENIRVALVGEHGPSNLDSLSALQAALAEACEAEGMEARLPLSIDAGHFFTYLWSLQGLADGGSLQSSLRITWDAFWGEHLTVSAGRDRKTSKPLWTIEAAVWALNQYAAREPFLQAAQLVVCSEPLWLCVLLHAAWGGKGLLTRASAAGRAMCLLVDFEQVFGIDEVANYWPHVHAWAADASPKGAISATSRMTAEMLAFQAGVRAPYVPCLSLHVADVAPYAPAHHEVLFFRSSLPGASPFRRLLKLMAAAWGWQERIVFMTTSMSYAEIASYRAVVMLPHIPSALRLADMYAMGMPLFIPDEPLIHKFVWPDDPLPLLSVAVDLEAPNRSNPPYSPLDFQITDEKRKFYKHIDDRHYWLQYTEWQVRPNLLRFSSAWDLLHKVKLTETEAQIWSSKVRSSQAELKQEALAYWRAALAAAIF